MEKVERYRQLVKDLLSSLAVSNDPDIECQLICDTEHDHYQIVEMGWKNLKRIYACYVHIDIKNEKIWIQHNMTEIDLGQMLVEMDIPNTDIILGLQPSYKRPYTQYGVA